MNKHTADNDFSLEETTAYGEYPAQCANCKSTGELFDFWPEDTPRPIRMCEECCGEEAKLEAKAAALVAVESCCPARARIIELASKTLGLVNMLESHDLTCPLCRPAQKIEPMQAGLAFDPSHYSDCANWVDEPCDCPVKHLGVA